MPNAKEFPTRSNAAGHACDLCGYAIRGRAVEDADAAGDRRFCCTGCRQVYTILLQAAGTADPDAFRRSELFRRCRESGIIRQPAAERKPGPAAAVPDGPGLDLTLTLENLWCPACAWLVETVLARTAGVASAVCRFETDRLQVRYNPVATDPARIVEVLRRFGYRAKRPGDSPDRGSERREWIRFGVSALLSMNVMMLSWALYVGFFSAMTEEAVASMSWPMAVMAAVVVGYGGGPFLARAWRGATRAAFGMDCLVAVGALSAFGLSTVNLLTGSLHLYYDTACMLVTLVLLGRLIERRAKGDVRAGLDTLLTLMPEKVCIVAEGFPMGRYASVDRLAAGDLLRVAENEIAAADGVVVSGHGTIDEASLTGEPMPILKRPGDSIRSGSRVRRGSFTICAERAGSESTLGQMVALIREAVEDRGLRDDRLDALLRWFVPAILLLAALTGWGVWASGGGSESAVMRAVAVTVIACPCALGMAIPLARVAGLALGARRGMLIRTFAAFERVRGIDTLVLDKTGTVTCGDWRLQEIVAFGDFTREKALGLAAGLEQGADHPIAVELRRESQERLLRPERVKVIQAEGSGVSGLWEGLEVKIGSSAFLTDEFAGRELPPAVGAARDAGRSLVYLGAGGQPAAVFVFGDALRPNTVETVAALLRAGIRPILVSGDGAGTTRAVGRRLGIAETRGEQLPADKAALVAELRRHGRRVAVVGDGVNDAPAMAAADLSLAVFSGGSLGREVADATLMRSDPLQIPEFFDFAGSVNRTIRRNLILTFCYNAIAVPVAMAGFLSPLVAVCAMLLSSLSVLANTLRLVHAKPDKANAAS
jgi:heavy metal translocating P-type ATPase